LTKNAGESISRTHEVEVKTNMYEPGCTLEQSCSCLKKDGAVFGRLAVEFGLNFKIVYWPQEREVVPVTTDWDYFWNEDYNARFDT
jgi:hypothetical protein